MLQCPILLPQVLKVSVVKQCVVSSLDGYRCLAGKDASGVSLWSRRANALTLQFPAIAKACETCRRSLHARRSVAIIWARRQLSGGTRKTERTQLNIWRTAQITELIGLDLARLIVDKRRSSTNREAVVLLDDLFV